MATVSPGLICPLSTPHSKPVGNISLNITIASSSTLSGMGYRLLSAKGILTYSAWVPSIRCPSIHPPLTQCEYIPFLQYSHLPQDEMHEIRTLSPFLKFVTAVPTSSTIPIPSCPRILPA